MKMNKKGFTLIELLAVIAILSILLIIAIPGVLEMFNNGKKNTFVDQAQSIYKTAQNEFMAKQLEGSGAVTYCYDGTTTGTTQLTLSGNSSVYYKVEFDKDGNVLNFHVADASYSIAKTGTAAAGVKVTDIKADQIPDTVTAVSCATTGN